MSMIHVSSKAVANARSKAPAQEIRPSAPAGHPGSHRRDDEMTQAWSIGVTGGVTGSAREWTGTSEPQKAEPKKAEQTCQKAEQTCPPEVYIG